MAEELTLTDNGKIETVKEKKPEVKAETKKVETKEAPEVKEPDEYIYQLTLKFSRVSNFRPPYPPSYPIGNEDVVYDENTGMERAIRYLEGVNTIWVDEQQHLPPNVVNKNPEIKFIDGFLRVSKYKKSLIDYLNTTNRNADVKNRIPGIQPSFRLINFNIDQSKELKAIEKRIEAMRIAMNATEEQITPHAKYLNLSFVDGNGHPKPFEKLKAEYVKRAEADPAFFLKTFGNPIVNAKYLVKTGFEQGVLVSHIVKGQVHWGKTRAFICIVPSNENVEDFLARYCFSDKGKQFYEQLKTILSK